MDEQIRAILNARGRLPVNVNTLSDQDNLYAAGLTSHASVDVMLALEDEFNLEFPDELLRKSTFESVRSIRNALEQLGVSASTVT